MPRMTRAALRAQAQADEYPDLDQHNYAEKDLDSQRAPSALIHEDALENEIGEEAETDIHNTDNFAVRQALRDITDENYPKADLNVEVQSLSPVKQQEQEEEQEPQKSTRNPRGKAKGRTKKKAATPITIEPEDEQPSADTGSDLIQPSEPEQITSNESRDTTQPDGEQLQTIEQPLVESGSVTINNQTSEPGPAIEEEIPQPPISQDPVLKTPKFDPAIHIPDEDTKTTEDSFVHSITSRSPSKSCSSQSEQAQPEASQSFTDSLQAFTPLRRTSSTNFEESFEAMDSLEDTIEQLTAGLPLLPAEEMNSPDSPVKTTRRSVRIENPSTTPKAPTVKTPRTTNNKLQTVLKSQDKENTPPVTRTPLKSKTPLKAKTPITKEATPLKARTPAVRQSSPLKNTSLSVKKTRTPATSTASEVSTKRPVSAKVSSTLSAASPTKSSRQSTMAANTASKMQAANKKPVSILQRKPSQRQTSMPPTSSKAEGVTRKTPISTQSDPKKVHQTSKSVSNPPAKEQPNVHKRRITSGSVLSTSKPGFIPAKSTKPPTMSTFALPGEAVAEKLKAQKEAREEKMKQPKVSVAEQKAAKMKAEREAREERVRLNQIKAKEEAEEKENRKPQRPVSMSALTISKARAEAAERGRLASKEWAEKMLKKKAAEVKVTPVEAA